MANVGRYGIHGLLWIFTPFIGSPHVVTTGIQDVFMIVHTRFGALTPGTSEKKPTLGAWKSKQSHFD